MMLAEYSDDLATLFEEGKEIEFFRDKDEMMDKIRFYLANEPERIKLGEAGLERVITDGHDIHSRTKDLISWIEEII